MPNVITVDYIADWAARLTSRLYTQFRGKVTWEGFVELLADQAQDLEDSAQTLFGVYDIDNSDGVQLDTIGRIVGQARVAATDALYRIYLKARILANKSTGTSEEVYAVFRRLLGEDIGLKITFSPIKAFVLTVLSPITATEGFIGVDFLGDSKESGAGAILEWQQAADASMMTLDTSSTGLGLDDGSGTVGGELANAIAA